MTSRGLRGKVIDKLKDFHANKIGICKWRLVDYRLKASKSLQLKSGGQRI